VHNQQLTISPLLARLSGCRLNALIKRPGQRRCTHRQARLQEARANQGETDAAALPGVGIDAGVTAPLRLSPNSLEPGERTGTTYNAGYCQLNWTSLAGSGA
jgi:multidrug efflux system outer membrane protein